MKKINEPVMVIFSENLKRIRKQRGLSQLALSEKANIAPGTLAYYETRVHWPRPEMITSLSNALKVHFSALFIDPNSVHKPSIKECLELLNEAFGIKK